jgi:hypothetical protein
MSQLITRLARAIANYGLAFILLAASTQATFAIGPTLNAPLFDQKRFGQLEADFNIAIEQKNPLMTIAVATEIREFYEAGELTRDQLKRRLVDLQNLRKELQIVGPIGCQDSVCVDDDLLEPIDIIPALAEVIIDKCRDAICIDELFDETGFPFELEALRAKFPDGCEYAICLEEEIIVVLDWTQFVEKLEDCKDAMCIDPALNAATSDSPDDFFSRVREKTKKMLEKSKEALDTPVTNHIDKIKEKIFGDAEKEVDPKDDKKDD